MKSREERTAEKKTMLDQNPPVEKKQVTYAEYKAALLLRNLARFTATIDEIKKENKVKFVSGSISFDFEDDDFENYCDENYCDELSIRIENQEFIDLLHELILSWELAQVNGDKLTAQFVHTPR